MTFVLLDERPESLNDGYFVVEMDGYSTAQSGSVELVDYPGVAHGRACGFAFADGHSEIHRWADAVINAPLPPAITSLLREPGQGRPLDARSLQPPVSSGDDPP